MPRSPRELSRSPGRPLWKQLRDDLRARLDAGEFGESFPGEFELSAEYGVSRQTVRQALREFRERGVVAATRGQRSRVAGSAIQQPLGALYSLFASVEATGLAQHSTVRQLDLRADAQVAERLGLEASAPLLYLERLRLAGGEPLAHDRVWLAAQSCRELLDADFRHTALYRELAERCGIRLTGGAERIRAVIPTGAQRRLLQIAADVPAFAIERTGRVGGRPVEWRSTLIRGDRFSLVADFDAQAGYRMRVGTEPPAQ